MQSSSTEIFTSSQARRLSAWLNDHSEKTVQEALLFQSIPAPTFEEQERATLVEEAFREIGLTDVHQDLLHNVYGKTAGKGKVRKAVLISAHLDTVFPRETPLEVVDTGGFIYGPGLGDNALGLAAIIKLAQGLLECGIETEHDIHWVATVGEEGLGDLRGMRAAVDALGDRLGLAIILEGIGIGKVYHAGLGVRRLKVTASTLGGHSWLHPERPSAVHRILEIGAALLHEVETPEDPRTTFNIGLVEGGTSINTRAASAALYIDLRSTDAKSLGRTEKSVLNVIRQFRRFSDPTITVEVIGDRPSAKLSPDHPLVKAAEGAILAAGYEKVSLEIGSTDANIPLVRGIPSVCIGITSGGDAHTTAEHIERGPVATGLVQLGLLTLVAATYCEAWSEWNLHSD